MCRVLTDRGTEYCGNPEHHDYELYLAVEDIDHTRTKTKSPQTNGICERFHRTVLDEFYRVAFRKKIYRTIDELQRDLDAWVKEYKEKRPHQGRRCYGKTPMQTFLDAHALLQRLLEQFSARIIRKNNLKEQGNGIRESCYRGISFTPSATIRSNPRVTSRTAKP